MDGIAERAVGGESVDPGGVAKEGLPGLAELEGLAGDGDGAGLSAGGVDGEGEVARGGVGDPAHEKGVGRADGSGRTWLEVGLGDELLGGREGGEEQEERGARREERGKGHGV